MREQIQLHNLTQVYAGGTSTLSLPLGKSYDKIHFALTNVTKAQFQDIKVKLNGRLVSEFDDGTEVEKLSGYYDRNINAGVLTLDFTRPELFELTTQRFFTLGTSGLSTAQIEFKIDGAASNPAVEVYAEKSDSSLPGWLTKNRHFTVDMSSTRVEIDNIPLPPNEHILAIHLVKATDDVEKATLKIDNSIWHDMPKTISQAMQKNYGRVPQANYYTMDFVQEGDLFQSIAIPDGAKAPKIQDFRIEVEAATAEPLTVIVEYAGQFGGY